MAENDSTGRDNNDLVLTPGTYAYVLDSTKGKVLAYVGPFKSSLSNTDQLVVWDSKQHRFVSVNQTDKAICTFQTAGEGQYIVLSNPAPQGAYPMKGQVTDAVDLDVGRQVNVPGPATFPLWPGQTAQTIDGHHLRHNQYLIVRVYDAEQAQANWQSAVVAPQVGSESSASEINTSAPEYAMGQLIVVQGTDVSFYIPPTGIEVVPEAPGQFVREAVTLERLEYCILLDENGNKRYKQGPDVVFPRPTEKFVQKEDGQDSVRKFRAVELNPHSGLFIKVIAEYEEDGVVHPVGEEMFITGTTTAIYFPRAEHSIIMYGDKRVHHAVAIPAGEGRYVLDRDNGMVDLVTGPKMFLPDPRTQVVVIRILDDHIVQLYYPGNAEALEVNRRYQEASTRLDPGEHLTNLAANAATAAYGTTPTVAMAGATRSLADSGSDRLYGGALRGNSPADSFRRGTTYTPPRSIVLDTKYEGAIAINVWPGYAVLVVDKTDNRRVEVGPRQLLLKYDESLMPLTLSTGTPKNDVSLLRTSYLRVVNNQVSDRVIVETKDLVSVQVDIAYRVNFEDDNPDNRQKWFAVENYVKLLTDHCRSRLRNVARRHNIAEFYTQTIDIIRDTLLGVSVDGQRSGLTFQENGMKLYDLEILNVQIRDAAVAELLIDAQSQTLEGTIMLARAEEAALRDARLEEIKRATLEDRETTSATEDAIILTGMERLLQQRLATIASELQQATDRQAIVDVTLAGTRKTNELELSMREARDVLDINRLTAETTEYVRRMEALDENFVAALQNFGDKSFVEALIESVGPAAVAAGVTSADLFAQIFDGTPFEGAMKALTARPLAPVGRNGSVVDV